ncbi:hypothetical protein X754_21780 [Mesorhizobium sp. LNJC403B00]|nr:hypothetical protein X754_21780 [Mesorhizobium sp. LNJC403B00]
MRQIRLLATASPDVEFEHVGLDARDQPSQVIDHEMRLSLPDTFSKWPSWMALGTPGRLCF